VVLWFPEEMAEAGYVVMIVDPQGQSDSQELRPPARRHADL
jgi:hypothetical protein